jgi:hypothetical protein
MVAANNHYAGFGPMTAQLFAEMMNLENNVRSFPIVDYEISSIDSKIFENDRTYKQYSKSKSR